MPAPRILLVEDNPDDVEILRRAFRKLDLESELDVASDGEEAMRLLSAPTAELVILDLKLPRKGGLELLAWMRGRPELSRVAAVVFTSSEEREDIERAKGLGAVAYLVKPGGYEETCESARTIAGLWRAHREGRPIAPQFPSGV